MKYALVVVALAACGKGKSKDECRAEAQAAGDLLVAAAKEAPTLFEAPDDVPLVVRTDIGPRRDLREGAVVIVTPAQFRIGERWGRSGLQQAQTFTDAAALAEPLTVVHDELRGAAERYPRFAPDPRRAFFLIDPQTPWQRVVAAVDAAKSVGFTAPAFVFEQPSTITPPPRSGIDAKLDAILNTDPSSRATELAKLTEGVVKNCAPLTKAFGAVAAEEGADKGMALAQDIAPALIACDCKVNIPDLRSVMFRILHVKRPLRVITLDPDATADRITFPPATPWAEASKRLTPALKNATLVL